MFEQTFVNNQVQTRRPWTVTASLVLQTLAVGIILLLPLLQVASLRLPAHPVVPVFATRVNLDLQPQPQNSTQHAAASRAIFSLARLTAPRVVPREVSIVTDAPEAAVLTPALSGIAGSVLTGFGSPLAVAEPAPSQPQATAVLQRETLPPARLQIGGDVAAAKLLYSPVPSYPRVAQLNHIEGAVVLRAQVSREGAIQSLQLITGPPLLVKAAMESVQKWRYRPTLLNGQPVEVQTEITVSFRLNR